MNKSLNVDEVFEHVKHICDVNRCIICDKLDGSRLRYPCGHSTCDQCATVAEDCMLCFLPPHMSSPCKPLFDAILTERVKNASVLLETCQEAFHTDSYKRQRLSDQLKIEKELFPECIQAPEKYYNKRKSLNTSIKQRENKVVSYLPGEKISSLKGRDMEKSANFVHDWLNKNEKNMVRKPFTDLSTNKQIRNNSFQYSSLRATKPISKASKENSHKKSTSKKKQITTNAIIKRKNQDKDIKAASEEPYIKKRKEFGKPFGNHNSSNSINDESGIVIDDEPILIDDSQSQIIDKDREAWLAVLAAEEDTEDNTGTERFDGSERINYATEGDKTLMKSIVVNSTNYCARVPFYKKSYIIETCPICIIVNDCKCNKNVDTVNDHDDVSITIESNSFITTIKVVKAEETLRNNKKESVAIQTDLYEAYQFSAGDVGKQYEINNIGIKNPALPQHQKDLEISQELFTGPAVIVHKDVIVNKENNKSNVVTPQKFASKCIVIEESDSDLDYDSAPVEVTAEVHRSCDQLDYGVLNEVLDQGEHGSRPRRAARGLTPTSTDSSEKENFNPNRIKKTKADKKYKKLFL